MSTKFFTVRRTLALLAVLAGMSVLLSAVPGIQAQTTATITTDASLYGPGDVVGYNGTGFQAGEPVNLVAEGDTNGSRVQSQTIADSSGNISGRFTLPNALEANYLLTATGESSGRTATMTFVDPCINCSVAISPTSATLNTSGTQTFTATVTRTNNQGNTTLVGDADVAWAVTSGSGSMSAATSTTNASGQATSTYTAPTAAGSASVRARVQTNPNGHPDTFADASASVTINAADTTAPTVTVTVPSGANANGWFKTSPVSVTVSATDSSNVTAINCTINGAAASLTGVTGLGTSSASGTLSISAQGTNNISCSATDGASPANSGAAAGSTNTATVKIDTTAPNAPTVTATKADGTAYTSGSWTNQNVTVGFIPNGDGGDAGAQSGGVTCIGGTTVSTATAGTEVQGTCTDAAGNESTASVTVKIDKTAPNAPTTSAVFAGTTSAYTAGTWTNQSVSVSFAANGDEGTVQSGGVTCTAESTLSTDTPATGTTVSGKCTDAAGNESTSVSVLVKIDKTKPTASASAVLAGTTTAYSSGTWTNQSVTVSLICSDTLSGLASITSGGTTQATSPLTVTVSDETASGSVSGTCTDNAGNAADPAPSFTGIKIDKTPPAAPQASATANGAQYQAGTWTKYDVIVTFSGNGDTGGSLVKDCTVVGSSPASNSRTLNSDTPLAGTVVSGTCTDNAGNVSAATDITVKVDKTPPALPQQANLTAKATSASKATVMYSATASDALSGLDNTGLGCSYTTGTGTTPTTIPTGENASAAFPVGASTVTCKAKDVAGNEGTMTFTVTVTYDFKGFFQPVDNLPTVNAVQAGRSIPIKFGLTGNQGLDIFAANYPVSRQVNCTNSAVLDEIETTTTAGQSSLTYDATSDQYNYVWKTESSWAGTCRELIVKLKDGSEQKALFRFRK